MIITETKTQKKLVEESNKLSRAYKEMSDKERKAFYNTVKGQVKKQRNALEKIASGKVSKRYKAIAGEKSPALEALERREGIIGKMPDEMPENFYTFQKQMESAKKFLTAQTATAKNWMNLLKEETARTEKMLGRKFTIDESRKAWDLINKLASTEGGGLYDSSLSSEEGYQQIIEKVFDPNLTIDQMMNKWKTYRKNVTPATINDKDMNVYSLANKQREKLKNKKEEQDNYFKRR